MIWTTILSIMALRGMSRLRLTFIHHLEPGIAPSRAKAHVQREVAVVQPIPHIMAKTIRGTSRPKAPPGEPIASLRIGGTGCPEARLTRVGISGKTKTIGIRKSKPANVLRITVPTIALGTWMEGCWTSSHMLITRG